MTIFALTGAVLAASLVYVVMKVSHFGESQMLADKLLRVETEAANTKKELQGYSHYITCLDASRQTAGDALKGPVLTLTREYVQVEKLARGQHQLSADATVVVRYAVEFAYALNVSSAGLALAQATNGVSLKITRPSLLGDPKIKTLSSQIICALDVPDKQAVLADLQGKFAPQARGYGATLAGEETVRNLCKLKAMEAVRDAMARQSGVRHVPAVFAEVK
ncbi:hypothetical protein [Rhodoferax antarcticus]|nr:hypothetical protein [Rhodoferax antarcticus]APW45901.1 hypothetical protein RA876_05430 [Rhodoferax antarcticus]